ncbi:MAG: succinate--CoA ligase subunit beta [Treponema sp. GWB1_62_6]|nr:MAG: succinate--CoA ligase subunit beta [Treponema sp. GWC1_61_84]OHE66098.1 MAG: succinate--CoA ligase subunit beta [Treponema sp. GWB1_62_6]OHE66393.1 MAG: succinate--CoA ligase subunit beta [Treponema sp. GWA1_62_8]HCM28546.1 ADP-forming succinate--CoA ligase subunit beta [Treponema sp.]
MKLFEYQSASLLSEYGIPVPHGEIARDPATAAEIIGRHGGTGVLKAQVLTGGRGKAGGVKLIRVGDDALKAATAILGMTIKENPVNALYVTEMTEIKKEYYISVVVDRNAKCSQLIFSSAGGMEIEEIAATAPEKIGRHPIDPFTGLDEASLRRTFETSFETGMLAYQALAIARNVYRLFKEKDCSLVEINPLALTAEGTLVALDAKIVIDDNALALRPELEVFRNPEEYSRDEIDARTASLSFVSLGGRIGCIVNGAGLAMATSDLIKYYGEEPANFLDIGGSSNSRKVVHALTILMRNPQVSAILMNIFGGITRCDDIAKGVIMAKESLDIRVPFVIRLIGTNDELGRRILGDQGLEAYTDLNEAIKKVISEAKRVSP